MGHQFGSRLKQLRGQHQLRQRDLEKVLNLRPGAASQYERGLREPGFDLLLTIADYFGVSVDYLLGRPGAGPSGWQARRQAPESRASCSNLSRLTEGLAKGLQLPVLVKVERVKDETGVDGVDLIGFVVRLDDGIFGPRVVVQVPESMGPGVLYRDPEEVTILNLGGSLREG